MEQFTNKFRFRCNDYKARNILTLEQRMSVLKEFDRRPIYERVASKFNCSAKQIKTIVENRSEIERQYRISHPAQKDELRIAAEKKRKEKIRFLDQVLLEFVQRVVYHKRQLNVAIMLKIADQVKESIAIENFKPSVTWLDDFMRRNCITSFDIQQLNQLFKFDAPKAHSLRCMDLIEYVCARDRAAKLTHSPVQNENRHTITIEIEEVRPPTKINAMPKPVLLARETQEPTQLPQPQSQTQQPLAAVPIPDIANDVEAMLYIKALQDYVLLQDNFRAIGLLTQLEDAVRNPPELKDFEYN